MAALLPELEAAGPPEAGVRLGLRILALDPLQEAAHRALMRLHARQGRRGAALARYQVLREALARELGTAPEEATQRLYRELRDRRGAAPDDRAGADETAAGAPGSAGGPPDPEPVGVGPAAGPQARGPVPLLARGAELRHLRGSLAKAVDGTRQVVFVTGEPG